MCCIFCKSIVEVCEWDVHLCEGMEQYINPRDAPSPSPSQVLESVASDLSSPSQTLSPQSQSSQFSHLRSSQTLTRSPQTLSPQNTSSHMLQGGQDLSPASLSHTQSPRNVSSVASQVRSSLIRSSQALPTEDSSSNTQSGRNPPVQRGAPLSQPLYRVQSLRDSVNQQSVASTLDSPSDSTMHTPCSSANVPVPISSLSLGRHSSVTFAQGPSAYANTTVNMTDPLPSYRREERSQSPLYSSEHEDDDDLPIIDLTMFEPSGEGMSSWEYDEVCCK